MLLRVATYYMNMVSWAGEHNDAKEVSSHTHDVISV